jgi:RNA polymerase sigma-70 factor, ECF subfamily
MTGDADRRLAFERLFDMTYGPVRGYVLRRAPVDAVEDVLSDVYLTAWRRFESLGADPLPWLFGVARRVLANQLRAERRRRALQQRLQSVEQLDGDWRPSEGLRPELAAAVVSLPETEREAVLLVAWEGLSPARAARAAGCSSAAFRVRLHRARRRLTTALAEAEFPNTGSLNPEGAP